MANASLNLNKIEREIRNKNEYTSKKLIATLVREATIHTLQDSIVTLRNGEDTYYLLARIQ